MASAVEEASSALQGIEKVPTVSCNLDMFQYIVQPIMSRILHFCPYNIQAVQQLEQLDPESHKSFALQFLERMAVDDSCQ